jgi:protein SCO1/2
MPRLPVRSLPPLALRAAVIVALLAMGLAGCARSITWHNTDITGSLPSLSFTMTRSNDGKTITAADYRGKVTMLYFGYTYCPDACPTTLSNVMKALRRLGSSAKDVRVLFVTVDLDRDSLPVLKRYAAAFGPEVDGLRGTDDALAALARRYRVAYSVDAHAPDGSYQVNHSSALYAFDRKGEPRLLITSLDTASPDINGTAADLEELLD